MKIRVLTIQKRQYHDDIISIKSDLSPLQVKWDIKFSYAKRLISRIEIMNKGEIKTISKGTQSDPRKVKKKPLLDER